jgi:hypothetical protein
MRAGGRDDHNYNAGFGSASEPFAPAPAATFTWMMSMMVATAVMPAVSRRKEPIDDHEGNHNDNYGSHDVDPLMGKIESWAWWALRRADQTRIR